jgi:TolB-like protein
VLALVVLAAGGLWLGHTAWAPRPSATKIAVQPFETIGASAELRELAAGLTDSLESALSAAKLPMVSRSDAAALRGGDIQPKLAALGVRMLFTGAVESQGQDVVVRVHLEDPGAHAELWSANYTGAANAARPLQAQVAARTTSVLDCAAKGLQSRPGLLTSGQFALFLHACDLAETSGHGAEDLQSAYAMLDAFRQVTRQAPEFSDAHAQLAKHLAFMTIFLPEDQNRGLRDEADREAHRALQLDPHSADAYVALGLLTPAGQFADREALFNRALAEDPDWPHANGFLANTLRSVGRLEDAAVHYQRAAAVNPDSLDWGDMAAVGQIWIGQTDEAETAVTRLSEDWPKDDRVWASKVGLMAAEARWADVLAELSHSHDHPGAIHAGELSLLRATYTAMRSGAPADRAKAKDLNLSMSGDPGSAPRIIIDLALLGFLDDAFAQAERYAKSAAARGDDPAFLFWPGIGAMRRDRRFMPLAAEFGLVQYWQATGRWPDFCRDPNLPYDCKMEAARVAPPRR